MTAACRWAWCENSAETSGAPFCREHTARLAAAHTALDAERAEDQ